MTRTTNLICALFMLVSVGVGACSSEAVTAGETGRCEAGTSQPCTCPEGGSGTQACADGTLAACVCAAPPSDAGDSAVPPVGDASLDATLDASDGGPRDAAPPPPRDAGGDAAVRDGGGGGDGGGPAACTVAADCRAAGACPPDATMGCGCKVPPGSTGRCAPLCTVSSDCAQKPGQIIVCKPDGFCGMGP